MTIKKSIATGFVLCVSAVQAAPMTCELQQTLATNLGEQAYTESKNHAELIDQVGLFDTWVTVTDFLLQFYKKPEDQEFVGTVKIAQKIMIESKAELVKKVAPEGYSKLLGGMTLSTCQYAEKHGWRK
jgi:hypothetical protein